MSRLMWQTKEDFIALLSDLVKLPSITGSEAEIEFPHLVKEKLFSSLSYFQDYPEHLLLYDADEERKGLIALVKSKRTTSKTIILLSHFDVVDVADYGELKSHAFDVQALTAIFYRRHRPIPDDVAADISSGNWLFGRGVMDMKAGLALHMSMLERACYDRFDGNLVLLSVPDEEVNSIGMRSAIPVLLELANQHNLEYLAVLNSEPVFTSVPGDQSKYIYTGTIGKVLPGFLCYGKETHVGEPFLGLNANMMVSCLNQILELNTDMCEVVGTEVSPPPTNLLLKDLKQKYTVQTTHHAVTMFNLFIFERSLEQIVDDLLAKGKTAAKSILEAYNKQAGNFSKLKNFEAQSLEVKVLTYQELCKYAKDTYGKSRLVEVFESAIDKYKDLDERLRSAYVVDEVAQMCNELSPMMLLFFAPPYYPAVCSRHDMRIRYTVDFLQQYVHHKHGLDLKEQYYFGGISDLSYVGVKEYESPMPLNKLTSNMPLWQKGYEVNFEQLSRFQVPVLNLGPFGRDAHKWTERLDIDHAFDVVSDLLPGCIDSLFRIGE